MPNRIIKESICVSEQIDQLLPIEEVTFYRLLVNCDDYGCFDAREKVVKSRLFPLREMTTEDIRRILDRLAEVGLIRFYEVDGKRFLNVVKWGEHQRLRVSKHKYPPQENADCGNSPQLAATRRNMPPESESESESEIESESFMRDDEAKKIQKEHDRILDAAEDAGFKVSNSARAQLLRLYADYGLEKMLSGFESCVKHGATNLAYLEACLKGVRKSKGFEQRDYSEIDKQVTDSLAEELKAFQKGAG